MYATPVSIQTLRQVGAAIRMAALRELREGGYVARLIRTMIQARTIVVANRRWGMELKQIAVE